MKRRVLLLFFAPALTACSPYIYTQEISSFSNGVTTLVSSYQTGEQTVDALVTAKRQSTYIATQADLDFVGGCAGETYSSKLPPCSMVPHGETAAVPPTPDQLNIEKGAAAFNALRAYAAALVAVTNAADDTTLTQATQSLNNGVAALAGAVGKIDPPASQASTVVTQASTLIGLSISAYLDWRRYSALRAEVPLADQSIGTIDNNKIAASILAALAAIQSAEIQYASGDLGVARAAYTKLLKQKPSPADHQSKAAAARSRVSAYDSQYQTQYLALQPKIAAQNQLNASDPATAVNAMIAAHNQLATALQNETGQSLAVLVAMQKFASAASQLGSSIETTSKGPATDSGASSKK